MAVYSTKSSNPPLPLEPNTTADRKCTYSPNVVNVDPEIMTVGLMADVQSVHTGCLINTNTMQRYTGGPLPKAEVNGQSVLLTFNAIHGAQTKIIADCQMTPDLSLDDTIRIAKCVLETLQFSVPETVAALETKKVELTAAGLATVVRNSLALMLDNHNTAGAAIHPKVNRGDLKIAEALAKEVEDVTESLERGIRTFSCC